MPVLSKKAQKEADQEAYTAKVRKALQDAHEAARNAADTYIASAKKTPDGHVIDTCGVGNITIFKPSYRFRETLKAMGEISSGYRGAWHISHFSRNVHSQSITAHEVAMNAARDVLQREFPEEPAFYPSVYMD
jgi:hypothetical protein